MKNNEYSFKFNNSPLCSTCKSPIDCEAELWGSCGCCICSPHFGVVNV